jgi:predicted HAD superfamily phosphohydrolase YqeG
MSCGAGMVEKLFNCDSDDVMYVGDHIFTDVNIAKVFEYMPYMNVLYE